MRIIICLLGLVVLLFSCQKSENTSLSEAYGLVKGKEFAEAHELLVKNLHHYEGNDLGLSYMYLASIYREAGMYKESLESGKNAIKYLDEGRYKNAALKNYARVLGIVGEIQESELFYIDVISSYKDSLLRAKAYNSYGLMLINSEYYNKASKYLDMALSQGIDSATYHNNYGLIYLYTDRLDSALFHFQLAVNYSQGKMSSANANLASVYQKNNMMDSSKYYANVAIESGKFVNESYDILLKSNLSKDSTIDVLSSQLSFYQDIEENQKEFKKEALFYKIQNDKLRAKQTRRNIITGLIILGLILSGLLIFYRFRKAKKTLDDIESKVDELWPNGF